MVGDGTSSPGVADAHRDYAQAITQLRAGLSGLVRHCGDVHARMRAVVDAYWACFGFDGPGANRGVSWCGFYEKAPGEEMVLICREPKPACSPIGLQGMCGRGWKDRRAYVVRDVRVLGPNYIACDPRDQSELVVPIFDERGTCTGVFDVDSYDLASFGEHDAERTIAMLEESGLLRREWLAGPTVVM